MPAHAFASDSRTYPSSRLRAGSRVVVLRAGHRAAILEAELGDAGQEPRGAGVGTGGRTSSRRHEVSPRRASSTSTVPVSRLLVEDGHCAMARE